MFLRALPVRFLYTQNPFYLISAALVLFGVGQGIAAVPADEVAAQAGAAALAGYASVLALAGVLLVRLGSVWDDARSILLIILLLLAGLSVCFDALALHSPLAAAPWLAGGLLFSLLLTELVIRGIGLPLGPVWRVPLAVLMATLFAAPLAVSPSWLVGLPPAWRVMMFPSVGAAALLTLVPAVHRGRGQAEGRAIPWRWPLYPWVIFGFLALCLFGRSYLLSLSFVVDEGMRTVFAPYFIVPLVFAVLVLVLEGGLCAGRAWQVAAVLTAAPVTLLLAIEPAEGVAAEFYGEVATRLGGPPWLAALSLTLFYTYAMARESRGSQWWLGLSLIIMAVLTDQRAAELMPLGAATPLVLLGAIQLATAWQTGESLRTLLGLASWTAASVITAPVDPPVTVGALLAAVMLAGLLHDDLWSRRLRQLAAVSLAAIPWVAGAWLAQHTRDGGIWLSWPLLAFPACPIAGGFAWLWRRERWWLLPLESTGLALLAAVAASGHAPLRSVFGDRAARWLELGLASLLVALVISVAKAASWQRLWRWARAHFTSA